MFFFLAKASFRITWAIVMLGHCPVTSLAWDYSYIVVQSNLFVGPMLIF